VPAIAVRVLVPGAHGVCCEMTGFAPLNIDYGLGYRVYFKKQGRTIVVLPAGGDKRTRSDDVETALRLARNL